MMRNKAILILWFATTLAITAKAETVQPAKAEMKARRARVTATYNTCIRNARANFDPKRDADFVGMIIKCREYAVMTTK